MYARKNQTFLPIAVCLMGIGGLALRWLLYALAVDSRGLLLRNHPLEILLWALTGAALILCALAGRKSQGTAAYEENFPGSLAALAGHAAWAAGVLFTVLSAEPKMPGGLGDAWRVLGYASVPCLLAAGAARLRGKQPFFLLHMIPCLYLVVHTVNHYQSWCSDPQLQNYIFSLLGVVALMLFAFYFASFAAGLGHRRLQKAMGLMAVYLCITALPECEYPWLYLGGAFWALTNLPGNFPRHRRFEETV